MVLLGHDGRDEEHQPHSLTIRVANSDFTGAKQLTDTQVDTCPRFTPDGTRSIFSRRGQLGQLLSVPVAGGRVKQVYIGLNIWDFTFTPNGKQILFVSPDCN